MIIISFHFYNFEKLYFSFQANHHSSILCSGTVNDFAYLQRVELFLDFRRNLPHPTLLFWLWVGFLLQSAFPEEPQTSVFTQANAEVSTGMQPTGSSFALVLQGWGLHLYPNLCTCCQK